MRLTGYTRQDGRYAEVLDATLYTAQVFASGQTLGVVREAGEAECARMILETSAVSGTNPTLDVTLLTSKDGVNGWRSVGSFTQQTGVGKSFKAVSSSGTSPPAVTLTFTTGTEANREFAGGLRVECTTLGARGVSVIRYSIDGGTTWTENVTTAATINLLDAANANADTNVVLNMANAAAAVDNVWTAVHAGFQSKTFPGCDRFVRAVSRVGGSSTPTVTASLTGEAA